MIRPRVKQFVKLRFYLRNTLNRGFELQRLWQPDAQGGVCLPRVTAGGVVAEYASGTGADVRAAGAAATASAQRDDQSACNNKVEWGTF